MDRARGKVDGKIGMVRDRKPKALEVGGRGRGGRHNISLGQDVNGVFFLFFWKRSISSRVTFWKSLGSIVLSKNINSRHLAIAGNCLFSR